MSYSRKDRTFVNRLVSDIEAEGFVAWRDVDDLGGGDRWREGISEAIRRTEAVIVVISPDSVLSRNVSKELSVAEERQKRIVPVLHRPAELRGSIELQLIDLQYVDFTARYDTGLRALVATLRREPVAAEVLSRSARGGTGRRRRSLPVLLASLAALAGLAALLVVLTRSRGTGGETTPTSAVTTSPSTTVAPPTTSGEENRLVTVRPLDVSEMTVTASSSLASEAGCGGTCTFGPENLVDGSTATAWSEGQAGDGVGAWVEIGFAQPQRVVEIAIWPGWQRGEPCLFTRNARPQDVLVSFDGGRRAWLLANEPAPTTEALDVVTSSVRFDIRAVYAGSECDGRQPDPDMLISEIEIRVAPLS